MGGSLLVVAVYQVSSHFLQISFSGAPDFKNQFPIFDLWTFAPISALLFYVSLTCTVSPKGNISKQL